MVVFTVRYGEMFGALRDQIWSRLAESLYFDLGFFAVGAGADEFAAAGTAGAVFFGDGFGEVDAGDVGDGGEPGQDVREFAETLFVSAAAEGGGELADFFHEPKEGAFDSAGLIFFKIHLADEGLEVSEGDAGWLIGIGGGGSHGACLAGEGRIYRLAMIMNEIARMNKSGGGISNAPELF